MINFRDILGGLLVVGFMGATGLLFWRTIPTENEQLIAYMLGQLSGFVGGVVALHYAAKAGEKELDAQRAENTGAAFRAIETVTNSHPAAPAEVTVVNSERNPVPVEGRDA